jgi:SAM-dependent methyltransferase
MTKDGTFMAMECRLCGGSLRCIIPNGKDFENYSGRDLTFSVMFCDNCQLGFTYPEMDDAELAAFYPNEYAPYTPIRGLAKITKAHFYKQDLRRIKKYSRGSKELFEIGCGAGGFLACANEEGYIVSGIEPSEYGVTNAAKHYGLELAKGYATEINFTQKYDIMVMRHVLEHINSFQDALLNIYHNGLKDGGCLFIKIPIIDCYCADKFKQYYQPYELPRHRVHFTRKGVRAILENMGFRDVRIEMEYTYSSIAGSIERYFSENQDKKPFLYKLFKFMPPLRKLILQIFVMVFLRGNSDQIYVMAKK